MSNCFYIFEHIEKTGVKKKYLFKDFSIIDNIVQEIDGVLDKIRKEIHSPEEIYILLPKGKKNKKDSLKIRFKEKVKIETYFYGIDSNEQINFFDENGNTLDDKEIKNIKEYGTKEIIKKNNVIQYAKPGTSFLKPSGGTKHYFIKTSLALTSYSEACFLAIFLYKEISENKNNPFRDIKYFYIDVAGIQSLILLIVDFYNFYADEKIRPQIINFISYKGIKEIKKQNIDFDKNNTYTVISASTSDNLRTELNIKENVTTVFSSFTSKNVYYNISINEEKNNPSKEHNKLIPLTSEDFSLEYNSPTPVLISKDKVLSLDQKKTIKKILEKLNKEELFVEQSLEFETKEVYEILKKDMNFLLEINNIEGKTKIISSVDNKNYLKLENFLENNLENSLKDELVLVFLPVTSNKELLKVSRKLRQRKVKHITYILGIVQASSIKELINLKSNITYNNTPYKYNYFSQIELPSKGLKFNEKMKELRLSDGFVFLENGNSSKLISKTVFLAINYILQLLRHHNELKDDISSHTTLHPENFSRFNDKLLHLCFLEATRGRELNFQGDKELSQQMKDTIIQIHENDKDIGESFVNEATSSNGKICLEEQDKEILIKKFNPSSDTEL